MGLRAPSIDNHTLSRAGMVPATAAVTPTSSQVLGANAARRGLIISNAGNEDVCLACTTGPADYGSGIYIAAGERYTFESVMVPRGAIFALTDKKNSTLAIQEFE